MFTHFLLGGDPAAYSGLGFIQSPGSGTIATNLDQAGVIADATNNQLIIMSYSSQNQAQAIAQSDLSSNWAYDYSNMAGCWASCKYGTHIYLASEWDGNTPCLTKINCSNGAVQWCRYVADTTNHQNNVVLCANATGVYWANRGSDHDFFYWNHSGGDILMDENTTWAGVNGQSVQSMCCTDDYIWICSIDDIVCYDDTLTTEQFSGSMPGSQDIWELYTASDGTVWSIGCDQADNDKIQLIKWDNTGIVTVYEYDHSGTYNITHPDGNTTLKARVPIIGDDGTSIFFTLLVTDGTDAGQNVHFYKVTMSTGVLVWAKELTSADRLTCSGIAVYGTDNIYGLIHDHNDTTPNEYALINIDTGQAPYIDDITSNFSSGTTTITLGSITVTKMADDGNIDTSFSSTPTAKTGLGDWTDYSPPS